MKEQKSVAVKITAEKMKYEFTNEEAEIILTDESYKKLINQFFRFIDKQLEEIRKNC